MSTVMLSQRNFKVYAISEIMSTRSDEEEDALGAGLVGGDRFGNNYDPIRRSKVSTRGQTMRL